MINIFRHYLICYLFQVNGHHFSAICEKVKATIVLLSEKIGSCQIDINDRERIECFVITQKQLFHINRKKAELFSSKSGLAM